MKVTVYADDGSVLCEYGGNGTFTITKSFILTGLHVGATKVEKRLKDQAAPWWKRLFE